ncbi:MAG: hypothetical protein ACE5GA_06285 [Candidatus Zixiibacteriota bacterium]
MAQPPCAPDFFPIAKRKKINVILSEAKNLNVFPNIDTLAQCR